MKEEMNVVKFLKSYPDAESGLDALKKQFFINVRDYDDRVVLNYDQIDSPRFHPIADECRALILRKGTWEVMARSFNRFYNMGEGVESGKFKNPEDGSFVYQKLADGRTLPFKFQDAKLFNKLDGSLITFYYDGKQWNFSTRSMAFAEGTTVTGISFDQLCRSTPQFTLLSKYFSENKWCEYYSFSFELTAPENRVVTPYEGRSLTLLAIRDNVSGSEMHIANIISFANEVGIPYSPDLSLDVSTISNFAELKSFVESMPSLQEGCVLSIYNFFDPDIGKKTGQHWRMKLKNPKYLAVANIRENGVLSPKNIMRLVMTNEQSEYLSYFPEDAKYFDVVQKEFNAFVANVEDVYSQIKDIQDQKSYALAVQEKTTYRCASGFLFSMKKGNSLKKLLSESDPRKLAEALGVKQKLIDAFNINYDSLGMK